MECPCGCFYICRTKHKLKPILAEHKHTLRSRNGDYPMAEHFKDANHGSCNS